MNKLETPVLVAVYGSLLTGLGNHRVIEDSKLLGEDIITSHNYQGKEGGFTLYDLGSYPAIQLSGNTGIKIEVYEVDNQEQLDRLDRLEGYHENPTIRYYNKTTVNTKFGTAFIYFLDEETHKLPESSIVKSGDWKPFIMQELEKRYPGYV